MVSLTKRQDFCISVTSTAYFFGTANAVAKPSHSCLLSSQHLPHALTGTSLKSSTPGHSALSFLFPRKGRGFFFVDLKYSYNIIRFHEDFQAALSTARDLYSLYHTSHHGSILYCSFHNSHPVSPVLFHMSSCNVKALCCSK